MLGYKNPLDAIQKHCKSAIKDGFSFRDSIGREQKTPIIPHPDVFRLIGRSKLPAAERFNDWVVEEVLPSIHATGSYNVNPAKVMANVLADPKHAIQLLTEYVQLQEENALLT